MPPSRTTGAGRRAAVRSYCHARDYVRGWHVRHARAHAMRVHVPRWRGAQPFRDCRARDASPPLCGGELHVCGVPKLCDDGLRHPWTFSSPLMVSFGPTEGAHPKVHRQYKNQMTSHFQRTPRVAAYKLRQGLLFGVPMEKSLVTRRELHAEALSAIRREPECAGITAVSLTTLAIVCHMRKTDVICPECAAGCRRIELLSKSGTAGQYRCLVCGRVLEVFDGSSEIAYRLTVHPNLANRPSRDDPRRAQKTILPKTGPKR